MILYYYKCLIFMKIIMNWLLMKLCFYKIGKFWLIMNIDFYEFYSIYKNFIVIRILI